MKSVRVGGRRHFVGTLCLVATLATGCTKQTRSNVPVQGASQGMLQDSVDASVGTVHTGSAGVSTPREIPTTGLGVIGKAIEDSKGMTPADLATRYTLPTERPLGYDPVRAAGLDKIQTSSQRLTTAEMNVLHSSGLVISRAQRFPTFTYGYASLYASHLPLFVSADSVLGAMHSSYDSILQTVETGAIIPELTALLNESRTRLGSGAGNLLGADARKDADMILAVTLGLLTGNDHPTVVAGGDTAQIAALIAKARQHSGTETVSLFGVDRALDFSQFTPRGHYTNSPELTRYFTAMIWLGRTDFRVVDVTPQGEQLLRRRQLDAAVVLQTAMEGSAFARWQKIDRVLRMFVGDSDNMTPAGLKSLLTELHATDLASYKALSDTAVMTGILASTHGEQQIASQLMVNGLASGTLPQPRAFLLFGQRYTPDSNVLSNLVYDRVSGGTVHRMMPSPLDVGFATFGNDMAATLLSGELAQYDYARDLHLMRVLTDAHGADFWQQNLYTRWLGILRTLSPREALTGTAGQGLPSIATTAAWQRRLLNTQLASWAELRHDTILYVKQSYSAVPACEFPDAYVEPYPAFFAALRDQARAGREAVASIAFTAPATRTFIEDYFTRFETTMETLRQMADAERKGTPFNPAQMAFINQAVTLQHICGSAIADGWFPKLYFSSDKSTEFDPIVADVHTQPSDEAGNPVGRVLHVGTGMPRLMVITAETCHGPRAYVGLASSYHETITSNFERLNDETWQQRLNDPTRMPGDVGWMSPILGPQP